MLDCHLLPEFAPREVGAIRRSDAAEFFSNLRAKGSSVELINRCIRVMKSVLFFALERELVERNILQRFRPFEGGARQSKRGAFSESEVQDLLKAARPKERALIGLLCLTGVRPG